MIGTTAEMIAEDLRRYGEDETAEWVLSCSDDELVKVCTVASWVNGVMLAAACALAAVYVREGAPRELRRKRRKPSTVQEGPLLQNGRSPSWAADERAGRCYPFYGVGEDAIEFWRPQGEHERWKRRRHEVLRRAEERAKQAGVRGGVEPEPCSRPTHVQKTENGAWWMSYFPSQNPVHIDAHVKRVSAGKEEHYSIYPLPADVGLGDEVSPREWIQTAGAAGRLTVEVKRREADGSYRQYTVGRPNAAGESESELVRFGEHQFHVRPSEVLTVEEAVGIFQHYYEHHSIPVGWHLRELPEFADTGEQGACRVYCESHERERPFPRLTARLNLN